MGAGPPACQLLRRAATRVPKITQNHPICNGRDLPVLNAERRNPKAKPRQILDLGCSPPASLVREEGRWLLPPLLPHLTSHFSPQGLLAARLLSARSHEETTRDR